MSQRTNSIFPVTIAKFANVYVEANSPKEAMDIVRENLTEIYNELTWDIDDQFDDSDMEVHSCDSYPEEADDYMKYIWADGEAISYDDYIEELEEDE